MPKPHPMLAEAYFILVPALALGHLVGVKPLFCQSFQDRPRGDAAVSPGDIPILAAREDGGCHPENLFFRQGSPPGAPDGPGIGFEGRHHGDDLIVELLLHDLIQWRSARMLPSS